MNTELATIDGEIIEETPRAPITLFGTDDPVAVVARATTIAKALADVIASQELYANIGGKKHVQVEGWTLLGSMLGVFAEVEWSRQTDNGWEARAVARTLAGRIVGAAESMCTRSEGKWRIAGDYAIRSMAQTRAVSKALRLPLGFIMQLAGYSATPAEEIGTEQPESGERDGGASRSATVPATTPAPASYRRDELANLLSAKGLSYDVLQQYADLIGIAKGEKASNEQMDRLIAAIKGHGTDAALDLGLDSGDSPSPEPEAGVLAPASEPPKPGTDEYKALQPTEKAQARAYWSEKVPA